MTLRLPAGFAAGTAGSCIGAADGIGPRMGAPTGCDALPASTARPGIAGVRESGNVPGGSDGGALGNRPDTGAKSLAESATIGT